LSDLDKKVLIALLENDGYTLPELSAYLRIDQNDLREVLRALLDSKYIGHHLPQLRDGKMPDGMYSDDMYTVLYKGKCALEEDRKIRKRERANTIHYWITTVISIIALILAIAAHIRQYLML